MTTTTRPRMTSDQATRFDAGIRVSSYGLLTAMLEDRRESDPRFAECRCLPYTDLFTFGRWRAQGFVVRRGEKSMAHAIYIHGDDRVDNDGNIVERGQTRPWTAHTFCRCQVGRQAARR